MSGDIICSAEIKLGACKDLKEPQSQPHMTACMFVWNIVSEAYRVVGPGAGLRPCPRGEPDPTVTCDLLQKPHLNCRRVRNMTHRSGKWSTFDVRLL